MFARPRTVLAIALAVLLITPSVFANDTADAMPLEFAPAIPMASVTISPLHLALPLLEVTGEYRLNPTLGVAVIAGYGTVTEKVNNLDLTLWELGLQANTYVIGDFRHGLQLGAEVMYVGASGTAVDDINASARGLTAGPYVGYKFAASFGLTVLIQVGYQWMGIGAKASRDEQSASETNTDSGPLVNFNLGWSF